jgi:hypothetical protein
MYARLLFVVVGIFGLILPVFQTSPRVLHINVSELRLGMSGRCGYTLAHE